ncbi:MAG: 30S ribosomal protein S13 [Nitrosopumilus sp.]|nr:30S ribosomal protein S13 [Nitrosopumilus sp.]
MEGQEYRHIVRIAGNDIPGDRKLLVGLTKVKGVGYNFSAAICRMLGLDASSNMGDLDDEKIQRIEGMITDPAGSGFPTWFLNRRKDIETGRDMHLLTSDIPFTLRNDIERERVTASWRGYRHLSGLKVRGQRTRTSGRKGGAVGVAKGGMAAPKKEGGPAPDAGAKAAPKEEAKEAPKETAAKEEPPKSG